MSGGVDSSVAAKILKDQGYEVVGLFMKLWHDPCGTRENACCDQKALMDARAVADQLGITFYEIDARKVFKKEITDYFVREYGELKTPNPCVLCNKMIKFGWMLDFAEKIGCQFLATGHYARIKNSSQISSNNQNIADCHFDIRLWRDEKSPVISSQPAHKISRPEEHRDVEMTTGERVSPLDLLGRDDKDYHLLKGVDVTKDQSYFLWQLDQKQLSKIIFPLGEMTKLEVRKLAKKWNLPTHEKAESQEICFVENDYREFLRRHLGEGHFEPGNIVDKEGNIIGRHEGLVNYTIGQRKGIEQIFKLCHFDSPSSPPCHFDSPSGVEKSPNPLGDAVLSESASRRISPTPTSRGVEMTTGTKNISRDDNRGFRKPLYVTGFNMEKNELIVGEDKELFKQEFEIMDASFVCHSRPDGPRPEQHICHSRLDRESSPPADEAGSCVADSLDWIPALELAGWNDNKGNKQLKTENLKVKIRYKAEEIPCSISVTDNSCLPAGTAKFKIHLSLPVRAITLGQSAVFYLGDEVIGGGIIC